MNTEIVPFVDGSDARNSAESDRSRKGKVAVMEVSDANRRTEEGIRRFDLLGLRSIESAMVDIIGGNHEINRFLSPEKSPKYTTQLNPTLGSVKSLLDMIKKPLVLHLRGCDQLFSPDDSPFPFERFKTLTCLEISGVSNFTVLPEQIVSEMTQLEALNLSHLPIQQLPTDFFSKLIHLRSLTLKDCPNVPSLPKIPQRSGLEYLELSHLLIEMLPEGSFSNLEKLKRVILRGCSKLGFLPSIQPLEELQVLDLSHCTALQQQMDPNSFLAVQKLDLSYIALHFTSTLSDFLWLTHLFLRDAKMVDFEGLYMFRLQVLDVSGAQYVEGLDHLKSSRELEAIDLSRTGIESIDVISDLVKLRYLILRDCIDLLELPSMKKLTDLEVLDIAGCKILGDLPDDLRNLKRLKELNMSGCRCLKELSPDVFDEMTCLRKPDISKTKLSHLPCFANLTNLRTRTNLDTLDLAAPSGTGRLSKPNELYIVSTFFSNSGFDRFRQNFHVIVELISRFQENSEPVSSLDTIPIHTMRSDLIVRNDDNKAKTDAASCHISSQTVKMQCRRMLADLRYIRDNIGLLESCPNCKCAEELLDELTDARYRFAPSNFASVPSNLSQFYFRLNSTNFYAVLRTVAKLKLLVPPKQVDALEKKNKMEERFKLRGAHKQEVVPAIDINTSEMQNLSFSYDSLTNIQKNCLLHFTAFMGYTIKERILIHLWYGEGLIDPTTSKEAGSTINDATVEEMGRQILMVLREKGFVLRHEPLGRESRMWILKRNARSFVRAQAMTEAFFNVDHETRMLTPHLTGSQRACLLISQDNLPSSCNLWADYINSFEKLESFKTIRTLLNVNVVIVDIRAEWFSKMRNLSVLHLGRCHKLAYEHESNEITDLNFLEELKNMKQLKALSLEGFSTIKKLPDSLGKVTNLKVLHLRDCIYLEELPAGIGSLANLTHLDVTDCRVLSMLPKGIRLLSKLEVLKGFVITYQIGGQQHSNACTLRELLKLEKLRKLTLVVHSEKFPDSNDLHGFNGMSNLCSLQITWLKDYNDLDQQHRAMRPRHSSSRQTLKCWEQQTCQNDTDNLLRSNLTKLELRCFPFETAPNWLHPSGLQKLEKLYIRGGKLTTLAGGSSQNTWSVKTLVLKYLPNMYMDWNELRCSFPHLMYLQANKCGHLSNNPCNHHGVWKLKVTS